MKNILEKREIPRVTRKRLKIVCFVFGVSTLRPPLRDYLHLSYSFDSTCSYVVNSYGTKSPIYDLYGRSRCVGTSIELIVLVESIDETQNEKPTAKNLENFQLCPNCMKFGIHANLIHSSIIYLGRVKNFGLLHVQIGIETPSDVISQPILGLLTR